MNHDLCKQLIIQHLLEQGFVTYAERFQAVKFYVTEMYKGSYCGSAFMVPDDNVIVINPGFFQLQNPNDPDEQKLAYDRISVLIRHELLHFLLGHERRFINYLKKKYPDSWGRVYANPDMHRIANFAMDYDLCNEGYDPEDKNIIRNLTLNGQFIGGLVTEDQVHGSKTSIWFDDGSKEQFTGNEFNHWEKMPMEQMWQYLADAHSKYAKKPIAAGGGEPQADIQPDDLSTKSDAYKAMYMKVFDKFKNNPDAALELFGRLRADDDVDIDNFKI